MKKNAGGILDKKDLSIIEELEKNGRLSEQKLSRLTGIPMTTIHNRMKKLKETGIIRKYTIELDHAKIGRNITAFVLVKAMPQTDQRQLLLQISKIPGVFESSMLTGEFDVLFKVRVRSMDELNEIVVQGLRKQKNIAETRTMISYETIEG
ncbi:Lrp/AsnC family transcriptional regulator [Candidatus Micrarchaeota archaeon]|nr:Lrp/AsnC family transcriptional regulator [Candidatus Micrarchaeota archaeon]